MAGIYAFLVWEFVTLGSFRNTGLQCALDRITGKVIRAVWTIGIQKRLCLLKSDTRKNL